VQTTKKYAIIPLSVHHFNAIVRMSVKVMNLIISNPFI